MIEEIAACALNGVRQLLIVVGNGDNLSEVVLVPYKIPRQEYMSRNNIMAVINTRQLRTDLAKHWEEKIEENDERFLGSSPPKVLIVTRLRRPLKPFHLLAKLPAEIQGIVWRMAYTEPRMHTMFYISDLSHSRDVSSPGIYTGKC
jgi:hypothetical protein